MRSFTIAAVAVLIVSMAGCLGGGDGSASLYVKDAPTDEFSEVHVVFSQAYVHQAGGNGGEEQAADGQEGRPSGGGSEAGSERIATMSLQGPGSGGQEAQFREEAGWLQIVSDSQGIDVDLLNATGTRAAFLGEANLSAGTYTQIAVVVEEAYGIDNDGSQVSITVPSGIGRVVQSFEVQADQETRIILDLDLDRALAESDDQGWQLAPVFGQTSVETVDDDQSGQDAHQQGEIAEVQG